MKELKLYLDRILPLSHDEWQSFSSLFSEATLEKGEYFSIEERTETKMGFLLKGVVRAFYRNQNGIEYNKTFFTDNEFFGPYAALVTHQINHINIQALTDCTILTASYSKITDLFSSYRKVETLARLIAEQFYIEKEKREIELVLLQANERYTLFKKEYPTIENLIPQYHIASYLGITPTQLSRIRSKKP
ncbi:MAG TPA: Crp/Fnr family transcriptional regulator [Flavobacterium sp.]|jgi:CRP-like cAMP-binding protein